MQSVNPNNNVQLAKIMRDHPGMTRRWVAEQLHVTTSTVDRWLAPKTRSREANPTYRKMPDMAMRLLEYVLNDPHISVGDVSPRSAAKRAHDIVHSAIQRGAIPPAKQLKCSCSKRASQYHHPNYDFPMWIIPMCKSCHDNEHKGA